MNNKSAEKIRAKMPGKKTEFINYLKRIIISLMIKLNFVNSK